MMGYVDVQDLQRRMIQRFDPVNRTARLPMMGAFSKKQPSATCTPELWGASELRYTVNDVFKFDIDLLGISILLPT